MRFESILLRRSKARAIDAGSKGRNERWYVVSPRRIQRIVDVDSEDDLIGLLQVKEESRNEDCRKPNDEMLMSESNWLNE